MTVFFTVSTDHFSEATCKHYLKLIHANETMLLPIPFISCFSMLCMHNLLMSVVHWYIHACIVRLMSSQLVVMSDEEQPCGYTVYHQFEITQHVVIIMQHVVIIMQHVVILVCNALQRTSRRRYETHRSVSRLPLS